MATIFNFCEIPLIDQVDILVIGGGSAGCLSVYCKKDYSNGGVYWRHPRRLPMYQNRDGE